MEVIENELRWFGCRLSSEFSSLEVIPFADLHYGNPFCSVSNALETINYVKGTPNATMILCGDLIDCATRHSIGDVYGQKMTPQEQRDGVIKMLLPVKDKILASTSGNHEARIYKETGIDIAKDIAEALGVPYRTEGVLLKISFGSGNESHIRQPYIYWNYTTHGYGGARTKGAKSVKAERLATWIHADFYIMAHDHVVNVAPDVYLLPDNRGIIDKNGWLTGKVVAHKKMLIKANAYLKWGGYSESGGFPPTDLDMVKITLFGAKRHKVSVTI